MRPLAKDVDPRSDACVRLRGALLDNARYGVCCTKRVAFRRAQRFVRLKHWLARDLQLHEARALAKRLGADYKARWPGRHSWVGDAVRHRNGVSAEGGYSGDCRRTQRGPAVFRPATAAGRLLGGKNPDV